MALVLDGTNGVSGVDGTASNPSLEGTDSNTGVFFPAADTVAIGTGGTERLRVDSAGNLGLGVTPHTWGGTFKALEINNNSIASSSGTTFSFSSNAYYGSGGDTYSSTAAAASYQMAAGAHKWYTAPSGTAGNAITFTQAMTLDASGNLEIGTSSPAASLSVTKQTTQLSGTGNPYGVYLYPTSTGQCWLDAITTGTAAATLMGIRSYNNGTYYSANLSFNGDFQFNSGYGSTATAYGCRAWVNFDGTSNTANLSGTYSQSGTTVTVTATAHGLIAGNVVYSDITTGTGVDGVYTVATVISSSQFTYTAGTSLTTSGNITLVRSTIRASGNVSSIADNGTGDYTVNFSTAMPDANYAVVSTSGGGTKNTTLQVIEVISQTSSSVSIYQSTAAVALDTTAVYVAIFR